ncbi:hypothetical protein GQ55_9G522900 [Panicum hallii var. hallii]|uniref:Uncharacterized protein n=1 Tax=Panicum hallii var. hallii TaxID=1504633 RepID=A0A2T7CE91_9POAL|nr:hypothetical protein GQ55_9G522900 [Panicum hallii var. hallii]
MASLFFSPPRNRRRGFDSDWGSGTLTPPAARWVACGPLIWVSPASPLDKPAKWLLRRPGAASRSWDLPKKETGAAADGPLKRNGNLARQGTELGPGILISRGVGLSRRAALIGAVVVATSFLAATDAVDKHPVWSALVFPRLDV